jgi:AmmeMemoRadiSam system protein A
MIKVAEREELLRVAREAVVATVEGRTPPQRRPTGALARPAGAFVTLHQHGRLRGCIGHVEANQPLAEVVSRCAAAACSADPRFAAVGASELKQVDIEVSVLGPLVPVAAQEEIEIGRHGLVVEQGRRRGLLLPQVATEWGWDVAAFVEQTCHKAGLPLDAWQRGARLWKFEAEVFGETTTGEHGRTT